MDFDQLSEELLSRSESLCREWFPEGKRKGNEYSIGDLAGSKGDSLSINLRTGVWKDFATGIGGGDLISLYAAMNRIEQGEAYRRLTNGHAPEVLSKPPARRIEQELRLIPAPVNAPAPDFKGTVAHWRYADRQGKTLGYIARKDLPNGKKSIVPFAWADGHGWVNKQMPVPRPLYNLPMLGDAPVMLVEGEKAADAAQAIVGSRYTVMTWPAGASSFNKSDFTPLHGRKILLWPDADDPGVEAMRAVGAMLAPHCQEVKILDVADMPDKWDAADSGFDWKAFVAWAKPRASLLQAPAPVEANEPEFEPPIDVQAPLIFSNKPMKAAELFKDSLPEGGRIIFWRGEFYSWDGSRYVIRDKVYIEQRLYHWSAKCETWKVNQQTGAFEVVSFDPTAKKINDFAHALRAVCYSDLPEPQCWIEQHPSDPPAGEIIAFRNGFLHWPTRTIMPSTDRLFVTSCLDFDYNPHANEPIAWLTFLRALWSDDQESIDALADMFGYLLTDDTSQQKMFMFIGPPRSGKGTILRVLESLIGYSNRVSPSLSSIGTQFGLQPLIGKRLAMISDARLSGRADQQPIVENMLRISGEDALSIDRKNISAWTGKLPTRFVLAANELPAFSDASAALANRFILFRFTQSFLGREDMSLTGKLLNELPGVVLWALDGLERLQERGYLLRPDSANELAEDLIEQTSPIRSFVAERCVIGAEHQCTRDELFKEWKEWCEEQGRDHPGTKIHFGRQLSAAFPLISRVQPRENGTRLNLCQGIKIRGIYDR